MYKGEIDPRTGIERDRTELTPAERRCLDNLIERKREEQRQRLIQIHEQRQREQEAEAATSFGMPQSLPHAFGGVWREFRVLPYFMCSVQNCIFSTFPDLLVFRSKFPDLLVIKSEFCWKHAP